MKITITGTSGFVGQNLRLYLAEVFEIQGISRKKGDELISYNVF